MVSISLNVPADDGIDMSELGLDEHLHVKDYDYGDDDGTDMSEFENH